MKNQSVLANIDWVIVIIYIILVVIGWANIYSASLPAEETFILDTTQKYGKQLMFIIFSIPIILILLNLNAKIYEKFSVLFYFVGIVLLLGLFVFGTTIKGQTNWYKIAGFGFQPSEVVKISCSLLLAKFLSYPQNNLNKPKIQYIALAIIMFPVALIMLQPDAGSAMIFLALIFVLNRYGLPSWYIWTGVICIFIFVLALFVKPVFIVSLILIFTIIHFIINTKISRNPIVYILTFLLMAGYTLSVDYVYENVLESHQKDRIDVMFKDNVDMKNEGYNLNQSMIAIGSGGFSGKGYLQGTQTKGNFVPEQHTDYIFTTVGEEWGFLGSSIIIGLFVVLILRIIIRAEKQKSKFSKIYGYCVATILFTHFFINISMLINLFPTIGIPLPFFSYGGSSLWSFTSLLFIFIKLDANKVNEW
ncbi:rod shape-determining protein RodA [uncultured Flavobacterium sp.]|uniref:rod shape-determining protein RodA n=1 Tax=uncultured Flavobacterium sp. TaxID=165435 RepID=UPI0030CA5185